MADLSEKEAAVSHAISMIRAKVSAQIAYLTLLLRVSVFRWELSLALDSAGCWADCPLTDTG